MPKPHSVVPTAHVLIYGKDVTLLETRAWILALAGFLVSHARTADEVERVMTEQRPELLILCHTLSIDECAYVEQIARRRCPSMKSLLLYTRDSDCRAQTATTLLTVPPNPLALITTVRELTRGSGHNANASTTQ